MVERMHGMLNHGITALCNSKADRWDEYVDEVLFGIRVRTHHVTKRSPFYLLFGLDPRISGDVSPPQSILQPLDEVETRVAIEGFTNRELQELGAERGQAYLRTQAQRELIRTNVKEFYFQMDDWVKIKNFRKKKFEFTWKGPFIVHSFGYFPTYWLKTPNGEILKNLVNQANMAPWTAAVEENEDYFYGFMSEEDDVEGEDDVAEPFQEGENDDDGIYS
jgi:hypothetical protein